MTEGLPETFTIRFDESYWYLTNVYPKYSFSADAFAVAVGRIVTRFVEIGVPVLAPVLQLYHVTNYTTLAFDSPLWNGLNRPFMNPAKGMIVVRMEGWEASEGIAVEREFFRSVRRPIVDVNVDDPVGDFLKVFPGEARGV